MRVSVVPENLGRTREQLATMLRVCGVKEESMAEGLILVTVCEALTNCHVHSNCAEAHIDVSIQSEDIAVKVAASCYKDPVIVEGWFEHIPDLMDEGGRGGMIGKAVAKEIKFACGSIDFIFDPKALNLPAADGVLAA